MRMSRWVWRVLTLVVVCMGVSWGAENSVAEEKAAAKREAGESRPVDPLLVEVEKAIEASTRRYLTGDVHTPWQIMHGLLALRRDYEIKLNGKKVNALEWMSKGVSFRGDPWFQKTQYGGRAHPYTKAMAFEGHPNQFLAIMAMANVPAGHKLTTGNGETITVEDMVRNAQMEVDAGEEVTWTLWALTHYLGPDAEWQNKDGEAWSIERLVRKQIDDPPQHAACGGSHGLFALTYARNVYLKTGEPLRGVWFEADQKIQRYIREAQSLQNRDWSFSTNYFSGQKYSPDFETRLNTSGHTLEFLVLALPEERLQERWIRNGVYAVTKDLLNNRQTPAECGSLYHAMDALVIYRDRTQPKAPPAVAAQDGSAGAGMGEE